MKRLFFLIMFMFAVPLAIFAAEVGEASEIVQAEKKAQEAKTRLEGDQKDLKAMIEKQTEEVKKASQEQYDAENDKLSNMKIANNQVGRDIANLSDYLDKVANKEEISQTDLNVVNSDITEAQKTAASIAKLRSEFVSAQPSEIQTEQEAQAGVEKLGLWDTFKLNVQSVLVQTKAALASFFGNPQAEAAAHKDLVDIYSQLQDYGNKAKSAGKLAGLYLQLDDLGNAIKAQAAQFDALSNSTVTADQRFSIISATIADTFALKDAILKNMISMQEKDLVSMEQVDEKINDFLAELGYKVNKVSAYKILDVKPNTTVEEINKVYTDYASFYRENSMLPELQQLNNAMKELFGPDYPNKLDLKTKEAYDKSTIVQQGFEIKAMDTDEKTAFQERKAQRAAQQQTGILGNN